MTPTLFHTHHDLPAKTRGQVVSILNQHVAGTTDLFTGLSRDLDKSMWFLEAHEQAGR